MSDETTTPDVGAHAAPELPYKVICISMYLDDVRAVDAKVEELKARGHTKMSRSQLIRLALRRLSVDDVASMEKP